ncbi:response regulator [Paenibacillus sp. NPDC058071]|uniref:response regulator n=1 Tax=Paenibacillus sp. NPDC058071 TaxID=3346326 RepID=UPI0036DE686F
MYKIVLVDDEAVVREGVRERIAWDELGFECVADCENGVEALEAIARLAPHVVLTDINMPFMDGLELTREVTERFPDTKMIILTGYDDFEYAQQAIKLKVNDFILKPITAAELTVVLQKVRSELDEQKKSKEDLEQLQRQLRESLPVLKERFLERLATSKVGSRELEERIRYFQIDLPGPVYTALAVDLDRLEQIGTGAADRELMRFAVFNIVQEMMEGVRSSAVFRTRDEKVLAIVSGENEPQHRERIEELAERIRHAVQQFLKLTVSVGIGTETTALAHVSASCQSAVSALQYRLLLGNNQVISISDMEKKSRTQVNSSSEYDRKLIAGIKTGTAAEVELAIDGAIEDYRSAMQPIDRSYIRIQRTIILLMQALDEIGCSESDTFGPGVNPVTDIYKLRTLDDIGEWLKEACRRAINSVTSARDDQCRRQIDEALAHIHQHYGDGELSVKAVSRLVHMSVSYFSAAFKSRTGKTFVEYVTGIRMEKAKELLKFTSLRTYEVALQAGYPDAQYFSVLFKKHTGLSPTDYRNKTAAERA